MSSSEPITFIVPVNDDRVLESNFLSSPLFALTTRTEILLQRHFSSAALAYNAAIDRATNDLLVFAHQDLFLPESWLEDLQRSLRYLDVEDPDWGVLGCYGITNDNRAAGFLYSNGVGFIGTELQRPTRVQTLDEIVLIMRRSSQLRFNTLLPHFHLYGTDLCLQAAQHGKKSYAIQAFCIHNTRYASFLPDEFYPSYAVVKKQWRSQLPIRTSCIAITRWNVDMYIRKLTALQFKLRLRKDRYRRDRMTDPQGFYQQLAKARRLEESGRRSLDQS